MPETASTQRSRGMRDLLPDEMDRLRAVEEAFVSACRDRGYREIRTPVIEPLHLFTAAGTLSPQTLDRVYSFLDWDGWSGERVVLRPDSTIPAARLYAEQLDGGRVAKLYYSQNIFHFADDGSSREEWQCGVELIGDTGARGDAELCFLALDVLAAAGVEPALRLSHAGIVRAVLAAAGLSPDEQIAAYDRLLDGDMTVVDDVEARLPELNAPLRLLFEVEGEGSGYLANIRETLATAVPTLGPALDDLGFVVAALEARGARPMIKSVLARSFEYYSGLIVRIDAGGKRVLAGGRYDNLIALVGGRPVPASGFALYLAPLLEIMPSTRRTPQTRLVVEPPDASPAGAVAAHETAARLRAAGIFVETVEGMHSTPTHRLRCNADATTFALSWPGGDATFKTLDDVIRELEPSH